MAIISNRRKSVRRLWSALVIATVFGCAAFIYASLYFGKHHFSETRRSSDFSTTQEKLTEEKCVSLCNSKECVHQSNILLNRVNPSVDPCENFFEFACGKYLEKISRKEAETFSKRLRLRMRAKLKSILDNIEAEPNSASGKIKRVYDSCMKQSFSDLKAIPTVLQFLTQFGIPHWPNLEPDFKFDDPGLSVVLSNFLAHQEYAFVDISTKYTYRRQPHSPVNATIMNEKGAYETKEKSVRKYLVERVLQYFDLDSETVNGIWNESEVIQDAIIHLKQESDGIDAENENSTTILIDCMLDTEKEWIPLCEFLKTFIDIADANSGVSKRFAEINGHSIHFMQNIFSVLDNFSDRSIANYLTLNLLLKNLDDLNFYFRLMFLKDSTSFIQYKDIPHKIGRWQHCTEWMMQNMFIVLGHEYMKTDLTIPVMEEAEDLIKGIMRETADEISHQEWIPEDVRADMATQTQNLDLSINILKDVLPNDTLINNLYEEFHPLHGSFMHNVFEYRRYSKVEEMQGLLITMDLLWVRPSLFMPEAGAGGGNIDIEFGILSPPIYRSGLERLINFVSLSAVVAHEIGHTLQQYSIFRKSGERPKDIMDETTLCIKNQYSQFRYEYLGKNINGSRYVRENFADIIAISIIDKFIEKYANQEDALLLPAFPYFSQQLLYISSIQVWCASLTQKDEEINHNFSTHSLEKFRMLGMMQNSKGFAKAFNCSEGSYMNPTTKCSFFLDKTG